MSLAAMQPQHVLTAGDLIASDQFRGCRFRLMGGGLDYVEASPGVGAARGLVRIKRPEEAERCYFPRWVSPSQPIYLVASHEAA